VQATASGVPYIVIGSVLMTIFVGIAVTVSSTVARQMSGAKVCTFVPVNYFRSVSTTATFDIM
jgi:hypothetical protein